MKINYKKYARALFEAVETAEGEKEKKRVVKRFVELLFANNNNAQAEKISQEFERLKNKKEGKIKAEVVSKEKLDKSLVEMLEKYIKNKTGAKIVNLVEKQDKAVLGGFIIRAGDMILDASLRSRLREVKGKIG